ncbi:MAG TPA: DoxX family protein [Prevotellaceae bacterium]|nr:DoxX family protein [Prevotellaceae bacterium]
MRTKWKSRLLWLAVNTARLVAVCTFVFSGTVKLIDPHGTEYKIQDYARAFGLQTLAQGVAPLVLSVALAMLEFSLGIYLLFGIRRRRTAFLALLLMLAFTPLTLYLAIANPVSDCGCFGDALVLTNWQTFWKNVVLLAATILMVCWSRLMTRLITERNQWTVSLYTWAFALIFAGISLYGLPLIDFRPYRTGTDLRAGLGVRDSVAGHAETFFIMEKDGRRREFTTANYPDSTWTFVGTRVEGEVSGAQSPYADLCMQAPDGQDLTAQVVQDTSYVFLLLSPYLEKADDGVLDRITSDYDYAREHGYQFYCLTSSAPEAIATWQEMTGAEYPFLFTDGIVLKTMIRSNPGLMLLHDGRVVAKWPSTGLPDLSGETRPLEQTEWGMPQDRSRMARVLAILLWYVVPLLAFTLADRLWVARKLRNLHKPNTNSKSKAS